jgi:hypothetical protein
MQAKQKICAGCNQPKYIWKSHGKEKYCKECWYNIEKPKSIPKISEKMKDIREEYTKKRIAFLSMFPNCQAKLVDCTHKSTDVHHKAGRGENHNKISTWLAVCRSCHTWIEEHPQEAKELGFSDNRLI